MSNTAKYPVRLKGHTNGSWGSDPFREHRKKEPDDIPIHNKKKPYNHFVRSLCLYSPTPYVYCTPPLHAPPTSRHTTLILFHPVERRTRRAKPEQARRHKSYEQDNTHTEYIVSLFLRMVWVFVLYAKETQEKYIQ